MPIVPKGTHSIYCSTSLQKKLEAYRPLRSVVHVPAIPFHARKTDSIDSSLPLFAVQPKESEGKIWKLRKYCVHLRRRKESIEYESTDKSNQQDDQRVSHEG